MPVSSSRKIELPTGELAVEVRSSAYPFDELCGFAARNNPKRGFLFLSKVLGKHWPAAPSRMRRIHALLAEGLVLDPAHACVFIAMAETATGLGQGVFEAALERWPQLPALFLHSTRYRLPGRPFLEFQEDHCHAPDQYLYLPQDAAHRAHFGNARELVLIDDEISTGSTLCHLVEAYRRVNPQLEQVHFVTISDFTGPGSMERFRARLDLPVRTVAALRAGFTFQARPDAFHQPAPAAVGENTCAPGQIAEHLGRFGIDRQVRIPARALTELTADLPAGAPVLVLGTGEFMHPAFRLGLELEARGFATSVQATTRSPILLGADVTRRLTFPDNYGEAIPNYLYNVDPQAWARIIVCHETPAEDLRPLLQQLGPNVRAYWYRDALVNTEGSKPFDPFPVHSSIS